MMRTGFGALAALKRKRKKFSKSRNTSPILEPTAGASTPHKDAAVKLAHEQSFGFDFHSPLILQKILKRASSVPSRSDEPEPSPSVSTIVPGQSSSINEGGYEGTSAGIVRRKSGMTPSSTDESIKCSTTPTTVGAIVTASTSTTNPTSTTSEINAGSLLPNLPNITPVRGHTNYQGWL